VGYLEQKQSRIEVIYRIYSPMTDRTEAGISVGSSSPAIHLTKIE